MGDTLAHYAAYRGHYQVLSYLIKKGETFDTENTVNFLLLKRGQTAIDIALPETREWIYKNKK